MQSSLLILVRTHEEMAYASLLAPVVATIRYIYAHLYVPYQQFSKHLNGENSQKDLKT